MKRDAVQNHVGAIRWRCRAIDLVLDGFRDAEFLDDAELVETAVAHLQAIMDHADAVGALTNDDRPDESSWWGVAPESVTDAHRHPSRILLCSSRAAAEQVRGENGDGWVVVQVREIVTPLEG